MNIRKIIENSNSEILLEFFGKNKKEYTRKEVDDAVKEIRTIIKDIMIKYDLKNPRILKDVDTFGNYPKDQETFKRGDDFIIFRTDCENPKEDDEVFLAFIREIGKTIKKRKTIFDVDVDYQKHDYTIFINLN